MKGRIKLPVVLAFLGDGDEARSAVDQSLLELGDRDDPAAQQFREFAERFERWDAPTPYEASVQNVGGVHAAPTVPGAAPANCTPTPPPKPHGGSLLGAVLPADQQGRVRIVRPQTGGPKTHYYFDQQGGYGGSR